MRNEVSVVARVYDLTLWLLPHLEKFSRGHRFTLGDRIETTSLELLEGLVDASYRADKLPALQQALRELERLRYLLRLAKDLRQFNLHQYEFAMQALEVIGGEIGGWSKSASLRGGTTNAPTSPSV